MSDRVLRTLYAGMVGARDRVRGSGTAAQVARADVACFAATLVGLRGSDQVLGCREDGVMAALRPTCLPRVANAPGRLYAASGAAMTFAQGSERVVIAFFERHEVEGKQWMEALRTAGPLPLLLIVLPRWRRQESLDLCAETRGMGIPGIAVDAADALALYRVAQESLVRARMGGGAALIEAVWFEGHGELTTPAPDAVDALASSLRRRGVASEWWLSKIGSGGVSTR